MLKVELYNFKIEEFSINTEIGHTVYTINLRDHTVRVTQLESNMWPLLVLSIVLSSHLGLVSLISLQDSLLQFSTQLFA